MLSSCHPVPWHHIQTHPAFPNPEPFRWERNRKDHIGYFTPVLFPTRNWPAQPWCYICSCHERPCITGSQYPGGTGWIQKRPWHPQNRLSQRSLGRWWADKEEYQYGRDGSADHRQHRSCPLRTGQAHTGYGSLYPCHLLVVLQNFIQPDREKKLWRFGRTLQYGSNPLDHWDIEPSGTIWEELCWNLFHYQEGTGRKVWEWEHPWPYFRKLGHPFGGLQNSGDSAGCPV